MSTSESVIYHGPDSDYCGTCYGAARKHGRKVSLTTIYPYPVCGQCEQHLRNGLVHYSPCGSRTRATPAASTATRPSRIAKGRCS
jgi:hypothetical protein